MPPSRNVLSARTPPGDSPAAAPWLTLRQLNQQVQDAVADGVPGVCHVVAEVSAPPTISKLGHAYLELGENEDGQVVARMKAVAFRSAYERICGQLRAAGVGPPEAGMKLLLTGRVRFHQVYGLQFQVEGVDPTYTLGEAERRKREALERLRREGLVDRNRQLPFPLVPQRVAVISSGTAAGFEDFVHQLQRSRERFHFAWELFDARVQGEGAVPSLVAAFRRVRAAAHRFDVVVLVRGGGSATDLACFNEYEVAAEIARGPLAVLTGIGHERDDTLADLVAHKRVKTPTAAAETLLDAIRQYDLRVDAAARGLHLGATRLLHDGLVALDQIVGRLGATVKERLGSEHVRVDTAARKVGSTAHAYLVERERELERLALTCRCLPGGRLSTWEHEVTLLEDKLACRIERLLEREQHRIEDFARRVRSGDPEQVLRRGFSITCRNGKPLQDASEVRQGDQIETRLFRGSVVSTVHGGER